MSADWPVKSAVSRRGPGLSNEARLLDQTLQISSWLQNSAVKHRVGAMKSTSPICLVQPYVLPLAGQRR